MCAVTRSDSLKEQPAQIVGMSKLSATSNEKITKITCAKSPTMKRFGTSSPISSQFLYGFVFRVGAFDISSFPQPEIHILLAATSGLRDIRMYFLLYELNDSLDHNILLGPWHCVIFLEQTTSIHFKNLFNDNLR